MKQKYSAKECFQPQYSQDLNQKNRDVTKASKKYTGTDDLSPKEAIWMVKLQFAVEIFCVVNLAEPWKSQAWSF